MFHVCDSILVSSFLCPVGSLFSQKLLTCDWWNKVDCSTTQKFYTINKNLYHQDDGDEMIRKAYVMIHLHPDAGLITEPEERERQGKIAYYPRVDALENDLPNNYDDISNDPEIRHPSDDYSNQFKSKSNSRNEDHYNDHVLYSQEYSPKIYPNSRLVKIHKISNDHRLAYQNRYSGKANEYRLPVNEFVNEFQPAYAPTVPTVTTTSRRFYSPTVPMTYRSSTLAYDKFDQNLDSSIHLYEHGRSGISTTTPATIFRYDSKNPKNSTRGFLKYGGSLGRKEQSDDADKRRVNYAKKDYDERKDYDEKESYDQFYDEEDEIMEGRESIGLGRSSSERLEETTTQSPLPFIDGAKPEYSSEVEKNPTFINTNLESNATRQDFKSELVENGKEVTEGNSHSNKAQDYSDLVDERKEFDYETRTEEMPDKYYDGDYTSGDELINNSNTSDVDHRGNEEMIQKEESDRSENSEGSWKETDDLSEKVGDSKERENYSRELQGHSQNRQDYSKDHQDSSRNLQDYKDHQNHSKGSQEYTKEDKIYSEGEHEYSKKDQKFSEGDHEYTKEAQEYPKGDFGHSKGDQEYPTGDYEPSKEGQEYPKGDHQYANEDQEYLNENQDDSKKVQDYSNQHQDHSNERLSISSTTADSILNIAAQLLHSQEEAIPELSPILQPPHLGYRSFNSDFDQRIPPVPRDTQPTRVPIPYQHYANDQSNSSENLFQNSEANSATTSKNSQNISREKIEDESLELNPSPVSSLENSTKDKESIPIPLIHQEAPEDNYSNINREREILRKYNPNLDFTIRSAIWNQQYSSNDDKENFEQENLSDKYPLLNHRTISLDLEPPNKNAPLNFNPENSRQRDTVSNDANNRKHISKHAETPNKVENKKNIFETTVTLKPEFPQSLSEIEDTIEESNAPYQVSLSVNEKTNSFVDELNKENEKNDFTNFQNEPHQEGSIVYSKEDSNPHHKTDFRSVTEVKLPEELEKVAEESLETHNRTGKRAEIHNQDFDHQRVRIIQLMSELAKTNRLPRPFSSRDSEISELNSSNATDDQASSTETSHLRKEQILEQLERSFGQPLYKSRRDDDREPLFELPKVQRFTEFRTGKAITPEESDFSHETFSISKTKEEKERVDEEKRIEKQEAQEEEEDEVEKEVDKEEIQKEENSEEMKKTVVEMEFLPSLGFSFDTHEGREEYAQAILQGLVTEGAVVKFDDKFSSRKGSFDSTESTKNV